MNPPGVYCQIDGDPFRPILAKMAAVFDLIVLHARLSSRPPRTDIAHA